MKNHQLRVLVAEDDGDLRRLIAASLRKAGYDVVEAEDGEQVRTYLELEHDPFDALVTDLVMPRLDGLSLLSHIAQQRLSLPTVLLTGWTEPALLDRARQLGAGVILVKPVRMDALRNALRSVLSVRRADPF